MGIPNDISGDFCFFWLQMPQIIFSGHNFIMDGGLSGLVKNIFNKQYTQYWKEAVNKSVDGTIIADKSIAKIFLDKVVLNKDCISLDLGCSYGRMFDLLSMYSTIVYGVDIDKSAVDEAQKRNYDAVMVSSSTNINLPNKSLNLIFCWAGF